MGLSNEASINSGPFLRLQNPQGISNYLYSNELCVDGHYCFTFNNKDRFFKQNNPFSMKQHTLTEDQHIEVNMPLIFVKDPTNFINLYNPEYYLDDLGEAGWSCIVTNYRASPLYIKQGGCIWYSKTADVRTDDIVISKYATCRITLVSYDAMTYLWAITEI